MGWDGVACIVLAQDKNQWCAVVNMVIEIGWDSMDWIDLAQDRNQCRALVNTVMEIGWGSMDWTDLAQVRNQWWALVYTVMNRRVALDFWKLLSSSWILKDSSFQESLKIKKPGGKVRPARRADNLAAIY
jgi:hypothetical protein